MRTKKPRTRAAKPFWQPTLAEILAACQQIQAGWSEAERLSRQYGRSRPSGRDPERTAETAEFRTFAHGDDDTGEGFDDTEDYGLD